MGEPSRLNSLSQQQLKAFLDDIDQMPALPLTDAEPASIRVTPNSSAPAAAPEGA